MQIKEIMSRNVILASPRQTIGEVAQIMAERDDSRPYRLNVLRGSPARHLYERHGFVLDHEDLVDVYLEAPPLAAAR